MSDPDGSNERAVKMPRGYDVIHFSWSPDGRRMVFAAVPPEDYRPIIFVTNADGTGLRALRRTPDSIPEPLSGVRLDLAPNPVWSPAGDTIAFDNYDDGYHAIWVMNVDGSGARRLTPGYGFAHHVWSPDGLKIAYTDYGREGWIYVMNADGSDKKRVARVPMLAWTPAGILYEAPGGIGFVNPDGSAGRLAVKIAPEWASYHVSRDGRAVALLGSPTPGGDSELAVVRLPAGGVQRLTDNDRHDLSPSWSPDAKSLAFRGFRPPARGEQRLPPADIYVINADGSGERNLTDTPEDESSPAWAPGPITDPDEA